MTLIWIVKTELLSTTAVDLSRCSHIGAAVYELFENSLHERFAENAVVLQVVDHSPGWLHEMVADL
ncbi:atp-dependent rna helicase dbp3 [Moniliophthora roreri]|nr:atp-dependent rna helicase dbp3 [Moniliophthora roreri]